jgi:hypothetical protein
MGNGGIFSVHISGVPLHISGVPIQGILRVGEGLQNNCKISLAMCIFSDKLTVMLESFKILISYGISTYTV